MITARQLFRPMIDLTLCSAHFNRLEAYGTRLELMSKTPVSRMDYNPTSLLKPDVPKLLYAFTLKCTLAVGTVPVYAFVVDVV